MRLSPALLLGATLLLAGCSSGGSAPEELYNRLLNVRSLAFSPDGSLVAGRSRGSESSGALLIWDKSGGSMREVPAHKHDVTGLVFTSSALISASYDGELKFWKPSEFSEQKKVPGQRWFVTLAGSNDSTLAVLRGGGRDTMQPKKAEILILDSGDGSSRSTFPVSGAVAMAFSPDGKLVATLMTDASISLWDTDGKPTGQIATQATSLDFSPDGKTLASGGVDGVVTLWNPATAQSMQSLPGLGQRITAVRYSPDGSKLAYGCEGHLCLSSGGKVLWDKPVDGYASPTVLAFSPDGERLASAGASKVLLWSNL